MTEVPAEFAEFVREKRKQIVNNVLTSSAAGVVVANCAALLAGDASLAILGETIEKQIPLVVLVAIGSVYLNRATYSDSS